MSRTAALIAVSASMAMAGNVHDRAFYEAKFVNWMQTHKAVTTIGEHFVHQLQNFANNDDLIEETNAKNLSYKLGHNMFSHLSVEEWREAMHFGLAAPSKPVATKVHSASGKVMADSVDWVSAGAVTPVKDQGQCGSCWSFSATGALEGAYQIKNGDLQSFSEQQFVDCDRGNGDMACHGGLMDNAFGFATSNGGICTEGDYPYVSGVTKERNDCVTTCTNIANSAPVDFTDVQTDSDAALVDALNQQPVSIAIEADQASFQMYSSGVLTAECGTSLDHGVLAVGYGTMDGTDYWKVKNSWGDSWGMDGYILLARNIDQVGGQCGILAGPPSYPNF